MERVYILNGARSYIGIENGIYRHICAEKLGAFVLRKVIEKYSVDEIDVLIAGNAVGAGGNIARLMLLEAGLPESIPAITIDLQCASGLESIAMAAAKIRSGQADLVIAGGLESSSTAPRRRYHKNHPDYKYYGGEQSDYHIAKFIPGEHTMTAMLEGAEKTAVSLGVNREDLEKWVLRSHKLAKKAKEEGILHDILVEIEEKECNNNKKVVQRDEGIREHINARLLKKLPCILKDGQITNAANACLTNDGAAFIVLCSEQYLKNHSYIPQAEFLDTVLVGSDPFLSPKAVIPAIEKLLKKNQLTARDIDIFECNEAFAVIDELFARTYPEAVERYNILGGALSYGHPYGASGGIITIHAIKALEKVNGTLAVCSMAAAGGIGSALLLQRWNNSLSYKCIVRNKNKIKKG